MTQVTKQSLNRILRRNEVEDRTGLSRSTIYSQMEDGRFPKSVSLGARSVGWIEEEIEDWIQSCIDKRN